MKKINRYAEDTRDMTVAQLWKAKKAAKVLGKDAAIVSKGTNQKAA